MRLPTRRAADRWPGVAVQGDLVVSSVRTWSPPDQDSHPVKIVSVQHLGTADYYKKIVDLTDANPDAVVLYEGTRSGSDGEDGPVRLSGAETRAVRRERAAGGDVAQRQAASLLGLALHQPSLAPNYHRRRWCNGDLHEIDIMRAIGVNPAGTTAIDGSSAWSNTLFVARAQAAAAVAAREDRGDLDSEQVRAETDRIAQDITTGAAPPTPGVAAALAANMARAVDTDPVSRLRAMDAHRNGIRYALSGKPWSRRLLRGVVYAVTWPFTVRSRIRKRALARHRDKIVYDWRNFHVMCLALRQAQKTPVIVIFGAAHTPAHCEFLDRNRFTQTTQTWLAVMSVANPKGKDRERVLAELATMIAAEQKNSLVPSGACADGADAGTANPDGTEAIDGPASDTPAAGQVTR